jgi:hypothetical protein
LEKWKKIKEGVGARRTSRAGTPEAIGFVWRSGRRSRSASEQGEPGEPGRKTGGNRIWLWKCKNIEKGVGARRTRRAGREDRRRSDLFVQGGRI